MRKYEFFTHIDDNSPLAARLNAIQSDIMLFRLVSAPVTFSGMKETDSTDYRMFYLSCLFDKWMTEVVERLRTWVAKTDLYFSEFEGSWKYYASAGRLECINDGLAEEEDYDENGDIITEGVSEDRLAHFSIVDDLYYDDWRDIVQDTKPSDLSWLQASLQLQAETDISAMMKSILGFDMPMYKSVTDDDGNVSMVQMSKEEMDLHRISEGVNADDDYAFILVLCQSMQLVCDKLKAMDRKSDNTKELKLVNAMASLLLNMDFENLKQQ